MAQNPKKKTLPKRDVGRDLARLTPAQQRAAKSRSRLATKGVTREAVRAQAKAQSATKGGKTTVKSRPTRSAPRKTGGGLGDFVRGVASGASGVAGEVARGLRRKR